MDHEEVRGGPQVEPQSAGCLRSPRRGQGGLAHSLATVEQGRTEEEGLNESIKGNSLAGPERLQTGGQTQAAAIRFPTDPGGIERTFQVRVSVDERVDRG